MVTHYSNTLESIYILKAMQK